MIGQEFVPVGWQTLTVSGTAGSLTVPLAADSCLIVAEAAIRFRDDGGVPTASNGLLIPANNWPPLFYTGTLSQLRFIAVSGSATLNVLYYNSSG